MKFNERNVAYFASCNSPIDKEGFLLKRGEINRGYQRRWFVLKGNLLFYLEKKCDRDPIGVIILEGCRVELADSEDSQFTFQISFPGDGARTYILAAYDQEDMESWMRALACSSYDYMKAMVDALQRQLDELTHDSHGDGQLRQGRFSYVTTGQPDDHNLDDFSDIPNKMGIYNKGKTESLSHQGAPRQNAFQRNSVPAAQFSNPSYAIWDPLVPVNNNKSPDQGNSTQLHPQTQFFVENHNGDDVDNGEEPSVLQADVNAAQLKGTAPAPSNSATAPGRSTRSVFYENVSSSTSPRLMPRSGTTRAKFFNKTFTSAQGVVSAKTGQSVFHDRDVRSFSEMHAEFGMLIVKKINEHRQRKMSSSSSSS
ncbi:probable serine/threonine-protein kinase DDB_G0272282 [Acanthaster planci]|uniref:Probable serine/threonine-protein kinase DDB_G0272282 n=1 Tax=Acanthaster planci TaxID=133434 RepID=A0A8B7YB63_ACAPL|nr:probable serine/threonine-protein kinase DDB_G0272282 [Acanthaster planci]